MTCSPPTRTAGGPTRSTILIAVAVVAAAVIGPFAYQLFATWPLSATPHATRARSIPTTETRQADLQSAPGRADGVVPDGVTVFDDDVPAVAELDPDLLRALRRAATAAADDGVTFFVNSGWRSRAYQEQLLREAVAKYGSTAEAARWVATPDTSPHVSGHAIDIGHSDATAWLSDHGTRYGLCQIYRNEPWHFELRPAAVHQGCPPLYADPTKDPRMQ